MVSLRNLLGMGSSQSKDERKASRPSDLRHTGGQIASGEPSPSHGHPSSGRHTDRIYGSQIGNARGSRPDLSFLHIGRGDRDGDASHQDRPRETRQEREARRTERERQARLKEREKSMREESVDGGYLVTLGVYTGAEDFSKTVVRQLQIERRIAPFWRGLNDHQESWTEAQLVAAARGLPIPAPDEIPPEMARTGSQASSNPPASDLNIASLTVPIVGRSQSYQSDASASLSTSHPAFSSHSGASSPTGTSANNPLLRGRAKTLASTLTGKSNSPDISAQEIYLASDPNIHGQPVEAYLYKDVVECPICFMYYPPYLNRTRCCDQPICSECFVQIKRPDPHPPEHEQPGEQRSPEEEAETLVSEVAACPFCVRPEFGVTYEPPPFRRGLAYAHHRSNLFKTPPSAMSSSVSLATPPTGRQRGVSLSADSSQVITTDRVRPDWAKKLADARAHALRRSAAATALHNAAYVLGNQEAAMREGGLPGRRRRGLFGDSPNASGSGTPRTGEGNGDLAPGRGSSRRPRIEDLEELMMMEAIRLSLATEEERKRKEEKETAKEQKKKAKAEKKASKKNTGREPMYRAGTNDSSSSMWASTSMARSTSNLGQQGPIREEQIQGKGKQPVQDFAGFNPLHEPTSTLNKETPAPAPSPSTPAVGDAQRHLEESRANLQPSAATQIPIPNPRAAHVRQLSDASSTASSFKDSHSVGVFLGNSTSASDSVGNSDATAGAQQDASPASSGAVTPAATGASSIEPMLNFRSLTAMISDAEKQAAGNEHVEHAEPLSPVEDQLMEPSPTGSPRVTPVLPFSTIDADRSRDESGESSSSTAPQILVESPSATTQGDKDLKDDNIEVVPTNGSTVTAAHDAESKEIGSMDVAEHGHGQDVAR